MPVVNSNPHATVVITTKNRKGELRDAIRSAICQTESIEVLVIDDGSKDGTRGMVESEFPQVRIDRSENSKGLIAQRNRAAKLSVAPFLVSIDDDAAFSSPTIVAQTIAEFDDPRIGAVAIPYIDVKQDPAVRQRAPESGKVFITDTYRGTAHALRRDRFLELGGYSEYIVHQGEERDYCIRMLNAGYVTRLGTADPIHHFESPRRDTRRMDHYGRRNDVLFSWANIPFPECIPHLAATTLKGLAFGFKVGRPVRMSWGLLCGYWNCLNRTARHQPVGRATYKLHRLLKASGPLELHQLLATGLLTDGGQATCDREPSYDHSTA